MLNPSLTKQTSDECHGFCHPGLSQFAIVSGVSPKYVIIPNECMVPTRQIDEMSAYFHVGSTIWVVVACFKKSSISKALVMLAGWKGINELWLINKSPHVWRFKTINYPHSIASNNDSTRVELKLRGSFSWPKMSVSHWANYSMTLCFPYTSNRKAQYSAVNIRGSTYMNQLQFIIINIAGETLLERANGGLVPHANLPDHRRIHSPRMLSSNGSRTPHQVMQLRKCINPSIYINLSDMF